MQFNQILDHHETKERLQQLVRQNRLSHSLLFLGKEGSGALSMAIAFAQYILCERVNPKAKSANVISLFGEEEIETIPINWEDSCGLCQSCLQAQQLIHPDLHFSYPALKREAKHDKVLSTDYISEWRSFIKESPYGNVTDWINFLKENPATKIESPANKQGNITSAECEAILHQLSLKAFQSDYKIMIMWMPEFLQKEGNKLLKLIEEPPPDTIFLFVAENENEILPTILSRTQLVKIPRYSTENIEKALIEKEVAPETAAQIAAISEGNFREAIQLLENTEEDWQAHVRDWLNVILKNDVNNQLKWIEEINRIGREKQKQFLKYFLHLIQQTIRVRYLNVEDLGGVSGNEIDFSNRINKMCTIEALEAITQELDKATYYIERNAHAKMLFHALTIRLYHIIKDNSLILVH
ncbi:MAG: hypothetical protein ABI208_00680 [Ginsengibacter sp.]